MTCVSWFGSLEVARRNMLPAGWRCHGLHTACRWLGVDHVFLTDNDSSRSAWIISTLASDFPSSFLTLRRDATPKAQLKTYAWCAEEQRAAFNWMAFFDMDEYLVVRQGKGGTRAPSLKSFLDKYRHFAGLSVNWVLVGPSGREVRPRRGGVLAAYTMCIPMPDRHVKTIANTYYLEGTSVHPHNFHFRCARKCSHEIPCLARFSKQCRVLHSSMQLRHSATLFCNLRCLL
jgi:hypothetical protein